MKVRELIERLQALDPELMVVRPGYEGGVTEVTHINAIVVALNVNEEWYYGEHEQIDEFSRRDHKGAARATVLELT